VRAIEDKLSQLMGDNLRMEQRLLDMEYLSYCSAGQREVMMQEWKKAGDGSSGSSSSSSGGVGMTLIDNVLRDYCNQARLIRCEVEGSHAKRNSIDDDGSGGGGDDETSSTKVCPSFMMLVILG